METLDTKSDNRNKTTALERSVMIYWGSETGFTCTTSPSVFEVVQNLFQNSDYQCEICPTRSYSLYA